MTVFMFFFFKINIAEGGILKGPASNKILEVL